MAKKFNLKTAIISTLRLLSYRHPPRTEALNDARVSRGLYKCASCGINVKRKEINIDHIQPVIDTQVGWVDYNTFIERLFCPKDNFQIICEQCHTIKSDLERNIRKNKKKKSNV